MKYLASLFLTVLVPLLATAKVQYLPLGPGKVIAYEHVINHPEGATLIMLPGVNRALGTSDYSIRMLAQAGWNLLLPSLPSHPLSIQGLKKGETPYFTLDSSIRAADFAEDIEKLVSALKVGQAIPVTLSYSSTVGAYLDPQRFPHIIETVPLGIATEGNPEAAKNAEMWESWLRVNPFMAPFWIRQFRDQAYSQHWGRTVDANLASDPDFYGPSPRVADIKAGYVAIARAAEDFDFTEWDFSQEKRTRDFIFAGAEAPERMKNQIKTLRNYLSAGKPVRVVVVEKVGHVLPSEEPTLYSRILSMLASSSRVGVVQFAFIRGLDDVSQVQWRDRAALEQWMSQAPQ